MDKERKFKRDYVNCYCREFGRKGWKAIKIKAKVDDIIRHRDGDDLILIIAERGIPSKKGDTHYMVAQTKEEDRYYVDNVRKMWENKQTDWDIDKDEYKENQPSFDPKLARLYQLERLEREIEELQLERLDRDAYNKPFY